MADPFLQTYAPLANDIATATGLDPSVVLGIVDVETGGGKHVLGNNIFGISPGGKVARYPDVQTASQAFINLMQTPRYAGVTAVPDPAAQAAALVKSGYNTVNPNYARLVGGSAARIGKALGYQDNATTPPATTPPATTPAAPTSAKDAVLADPALAPAPTEGATTPPATPTTTAQTTTPAPASVKDQVLADPALQPGPTVAKAAAQNGGIGRNIAAGVLEGTGGTVNALANPSGTLGKMIGTGIVFAHDAAAPVFGYERFPDKVRNFLLGADMEQQPGTAAIEGIGRGVQAATGGQTVPSEVPATTPAEQYVRTGAQGATMGALLGPNALMGAGVGGAGTVGGKAVGDWVRDQGYEWAAPMAELAGGVAAGGAVIPVAMGARAGSNLLQRGVTRIAEGPPVRPLSEVERARATAAGASPEEIDAMGRGPSPGMGGPAPRSAGAAATPAYEAIHTPAEEAAYRATAEGQKLLEPQVIGERDTSQYIPGETVNNAEREQTVTTARELKALGQRVPEASQIDKEAAESNNTARQIYARNTSKSEIDIHNRTTQRETDINADKKTVFAPENVTGRFDKQPVIDHMEAVLADPENLHNGALQKLYREQLERVKAADFNNPIEAWSLRRDFDRITSKRMQADDPNSHSIAHDLDQASGVIDSQIEKVAPGYRDMLDKYKEHSRAIDEMTVLQGMFDKLRGPGQKFTYNDFQRFMKNVVDSRRTPSTDMNAFKAISDENMTRLWNIRDSLRRSASALELAKAAGSDTLPNIMDALRGSFKVGGAAGLHAAAGSIFGPGGNIAVQVLGSIIKNSTDRVQIRRAQAEMRRLMNPSEPLRTPPGQENPLSGAPPP